MQGMLSFKGVLLGTVIQMGREEQPKALSTLKLKFETNLEFFYIFKTQGAAHKNRATNISH